MKVKLSVSVDENTLDIIQEHIRKGKFRNRSHAFEYAINRIAQEDGEK